MSNNYKGPEGGGTVFACPESWGRLFDHIISQPDNTYTIISSHSDFGIHPMGTGHTETYILKSEMGSNCGLVSIPPNVNRIYAANCFVNPFRDGRFWFLPFGVLEETIKYINFAAATVASSAPNKIHKAYISFSALHHPLRAKLLDEFSKKKYAGYFTIPDRRLSLEEHLGEIARHKFVLCPPGNGADSYRVYEALYLNSIPIMAHNRLSLNMSTYYTIIVERDMCKFHPRQYKVSEDSMTEISQNRYLSINYWRGIINEFSQGSNGKVYGGPNT